MEPVAPNSHAAVRILIVDDDLPFRRALHLALDSYGYDVAEASDGLAALDSAAAHHPDVIVLDWHLPLMDGIAACRALHATSMAPIIMISGNRKNSKGAALEAGAIDYLSKPLSFPVLLGCIESALKHS